MNQSTVIFLAGLMAISASAAITPSAFAGDHNNNDNMENVAGNALCKQK